MDSPSKFDTSDGEIFSSSTRQSGKSVQIAEGSFAEAGGTMRGSFGSQSFANRSFRDSIIALKESMVEAIGHGTVAGTTLNTLCNIVGGGVLALPLAMRNSSIVPGLVLLVISAFMSAFSAVALTEACHRNHVYTLQELMALSLPTVRHAGAMVQAVVFMNNYGILIVYARVISDSIPPVLANFVGANGLWVNPLTWLIIPAVFFFVLSCARRMEELKWTSLLGFATILYVVLLIVVDFFKRQYHHHHDQYIAESVRWFAVRVDIFKALPTLALAFGYHYNVPVFYGEMEDKNPKTMRFATFVALGVVFLVYVVTGLFGYFIFGEDVADKKVGGSIVNNLDSNDIPANIGRLGLFFHFACVYPMLSIGARNSFHSFVVFVTNTDRNPRLAVVAAEALAIVSTSVVLAHVVPGIGIVIELTGSLFGVATLAIMPGFIAFKLLRGAPAAHTEASNLLQNTIELTPMAKIGAVVAALGVVLSIAGFTVTILEAS